MGLRYGLSKYKLLGDFGCGEIQPIQVYLLTRSEPSSSSTTWSIEIIQASSSATYQKMSDRMISNKYATRYIRHVFTKEQLSTRVGCGRVHCIIENNLDKCRVVAPNLPTKTDNLSHSTGHGWTTREKVVNG
uniref:Ulp1 protease-like protein n=1 Tax=Oryza sativa subsp. japonica TaxID=39947 RepID=Q69KP2_ORYSJ|nr:Ulp1 protease-like protein [Oryza sativa Japonica Group]